MSKISRRTFLWLTGGSGIALATTPQRKVVNTLIPQVIPAEHTVPGEWTLFATTCRECPAGCGTHLWHRDGRVTKAEGNPSHPVNRGGLCARGQSSLQGLYDPDRVQGVIGRHGKEFRSSTWEEALSAIAGRLKAGGRVALLSSLQTGALAEVMQRFTAAFGSDRLLFYEPFSFEPLKTAHQQLFGLPLIPYYDIEKCDLVLSLAADFLETWISPVSFAAQFSAMHAYLEQQNVSGRAARPGRMVYVGPRLSMTAANADEFIQVPPGCERLVAAALLREIIEQGWSKNDLSSLKPAIEKLLSAGGSIPGISNRTVTQLARRFAEAGGAVALAGPTGSAGAPAVQTAGAAALLNYATGRIGRTVDFSRPHALSNAAVEADLQGFLDSLGPRDILFVHDTNPAYTRPASIPLLERVGTVVHLGTMLDETARMAEWVLPVDSPLESWGDYEPHRDMHGIMQPTMGRLYDTRSAGDILLDLARRAGRPLSRSPSGRRPASFESWLRQRWEGMRNELAPQVPAGTFFTDVLRNGGAWKTPPPAAAVAPKPSAVGLFAAETTSSTGANEEGTAELWLWPSLMLYDGRLANRGWLQEAPDPITSFVWGSWIDIHPGKAAALGLKAGDLVELATPAGTVRASVRISHEVTRHTAALAFGQGHQALGGTARDIGVNAFSLAPVAAMGTFGICRISRVGALSENAPVHTVPVREQFDRQILQWMPLSVVSGMKPGEGEELVLPLPEGYRADRDMYPKREYLKHRWAMVIDLQRCIGCGACAVACYAENNIPVIGREGVGKGVGNGREMAWLRVAPYRKPDSSLRYGWLPLLCQHCDAAPCEPVCPVFAAMHNEEGLNAQIYNRCIGTRYCSNNCPYKVRRFNWINIEWRPPLDLQLNPEVTVRSRGVMEKCTFCVQRIRRAEYRAKRENRKIRDGEIETACMQSCPTKVFAFGDLLDPQSRVSRLTRSDPRRYHVLEELNTKSAVTYLRKVDLEA
ncbi:molybdopterin dinucleotide binding domain-containing protein [Geobacter sp. SVR]|uniref:molybdopterin dinucleotide binding domain-containing protein n=1 Tax=Geobacter sp. SVR TaxID=2495594 RepID=UPI00143F00A9|nr:molybdopterin dinucleotide binding domain-containing protein [Geobacter sp. SVR]BCS54213.1 Fe-S-cluster-containing hydrogenase [Geobacter sp. SVR]GCF85929.1 Fe-S-cluster-containing hydrogenase [Geobacter sp. SVR]